MGAGSFKADIKSSVDDCLAYDDGTVRGAFLAAWSTVNIVPPACVWYIFINPAYHVKDENLALTVGVFGGLIGIIPTIATFVLFLVPGILAAGVGAFAGFIRRIKQ